MKKGTIYWITGLSGAGKTTIGTRFYQKLKEKKDTVILLDGDDIRNILGDLIGYSDEERRKGSMIISRMCHCLANQGIDVVCCTVSMNDRCREWNRGNNDCYKEIYLEVPLEELKRRDVKGLYKKVTNGEIQNVVGVDMEFEQPKHPDLIIKNFGENTIEDSLNSMYEEFLGKE